MNQFLSLWRGRLARQSDKALLTRLREDAGYASEVAAARLHLRHCDWLGPWVRVVGQPMVENLGRIEIGSRTRIDSTFAPIELKTGPQGSIRIGKQGAINYGTMISANRSVSIGDRVGIGPYCIVSDSEFGETDGAPAGESKPIEIGNGVWLASRVTVLPGTTIGDGAVITAGSIVAGNIPSRVVAGGNPARVLRRLDEGSAAEEPRADVASNGATGAVLTRPATSVKRAEPVHHGLLVSDFTIDDLARYLDEDPNTPGLTATVAPYGQVIPSLMAAKNAEHDYAVVWTRPEGALPSFGRLLEFELVDDQALLSEVDAFASLLIEGLKPYRFGFVPTWTVPPWRRGQGLADARAHGITRALYAINQRLMARLEAVPNIFVLNAQRWCDEVGKGAHSAKLWYLGKVPFHSSVFEQAAADIKAAIQNMTGMGRKLVIVDLDDTLWGGVVGDVGWEHLRLGGHDSVGEAFVDFQRALKSLKRRGILLGIVSKNDEATALEAMRKNPEMILKEEDFVGWRINWMDKAKNVADLVADLNLGLQSTVFIDDNPFERARVREVLPDVLVPDWPEDKLAYASSLLSLRCFDTPARTAEDATRTEMYTSDRKRDELQAQVGSLDEWLGSLDIRVRLEGLTASNLARTAQLLNKTNQMNLSTRRLTEAELSEWAKESHRRLWTLTVSDRLGDAGLTGILSMETDGSVGRIVDFVLSCRVMGRRIEETMAHLAIDAAREMSLAEVVAELVPTAKNKPCLEFWERSGFQRADATRFVWDTHREYPRPAMISLERAP